MATAHPVTTVLGPVAQQTLGRVLPHEHLFINTMREYRGTGLLDDLELMIEELTAYREAGGGTIIDVTPGHMGRRPEQLRAAAEATGVHVVMGCGWYRDPYLEDTEIEIRSVDELASDLVAEILDPRLGAIRPGIIGEIGCDGPHISPREERCLRAAARAQRQTDLTITLHAARWPVGLALLDLLEEEGVDPARVIVGHSDTVLDEAYHLALAQRGVWVQFDTVGTGTELELRRIERYTANLLEHGYLDRLLLSHDIFLRGHLLADDGPGYGYLFQHFLPRLGAMGMTDDHLEQLVTVNPQRALVGS